MAAKENVSESVQAPTFSQVARKVENHFCTGADSVVVLDVDGTYLQNLSEVVGIHLGPLGLLTRRSRGRKAERTTALLALLNQLGDVSKLVVWSAREPRLGLVPKGLRREIESVVADHNENPTIKTKTEVAFVLGWDKHFGQKRLQQELAPHIANNESIIVMGNGRNDRRRARRMGAFYGEVKREKHASRTRG